jgi:hypothetical protein
MINATWLAIVTRLGVLLWLATDKFFLLVVAALVGLAVALGVNAYRDPPAGSGAGQGRPSR